MGLNIAGMDATGTQGTPEVDYTGQGAIGADIGYVPGYSPVVPDISFLDLPGQFLSIPGGAVSNGANASADSTGVNQIYTDPKVNPTPTGGYMTALAQIAAAASQSFTTFIKGSPSVAIPASRTASGRTVGGGFLTTPQGGTNWWVVGGVVAVGLLGMVLVVKYA